MDSDDFEQSVSGFLIYLFVHPDKKIKSYCNFEIAMI